MKGLKITFEATGATISTSEKVEGVAAQVQNSLVNIAQQKGSDKLFPNKGTDIFRQALQGRIAGLQEAHHLSNFAALDTLFFIRDTLRDQDMTKISRVVLKPFEYSGNRLRITSSFEFSDGSVVGREDIL